MMELSLARGIDLFSIKPAPLLHPSSFWVVSLGHPLSFERTKITLAKNENIEYLNQIWHCYQSGVVKLFCQCSIAALKE